jgi:hypothetical protein
MTSSLYNEALNDARAIREAAEERAKQQLLESMSPRLKKIVESTINEEMGLSDQFDEDEDFQEGQMNNSSQKIKMGEAQRINLDEDDEDNNDVDECGSSMYSESDDNEDNLEESDEEDVYSENDGMDEEYSENIQSESAKKVLKMLLNKDVLKRNLKTEVNNFQNDVKSLKKMFTIMENNKVKPATIQKVDKTLIKLVENSKNIASNNIIKNQTEIKQIFSNSLQELNQMTRRRNNILAENYASLARRSRRLFEADDEENQDDLNLDSDAGSEDASADMDLDSGDMGDMGGDDMGDMGGDLSAADADELRSIADKIEAMIGGGSGEEMEMGDEEEEMPEEEEVPEEEEEETKKEWSRRRGRMFFESDDEDEDLEENEYCEEDEELAESYFFEADKKSAAQKKKEAEKKKKEAEKKKKEAEKKKNEAQRRRGDVFLEIDENMLRREIARMKRLREGDAVAMASHFGGGKAEDEMFIDVDDSDLNVHANDLGSFHKGGSLKEGRSYNSNGQTRLLESKVQNYQRALSGMKNQLSEMNLFNAKLLYANKLMQNRDLSSSQQRHIVESLDQARTLREAKLLFEGLSKSLMKGTGRSGSLNESATRRIAGGSSRSTASAQAFNNRVETDRWALLAGIKK